MVILMAIGKEDFPDNILKINLHNNFEKIKINFLIMEGIKLILKSIKKRERENIFPFPQSLFLNHFQQINIKNECCVWCDSTFSAFTIS